MAKKRRTRKQKERADLRHSHPNHQVASPTIDSVQEQEELSERSSLYQFKPISSSVPQSSVSKNSSTIDYHYLRKDLRKTAILSVLIILAQLALFFLMNSK